MCRGQAAGHQGRLLRASLPRQMGQVSCSDHSRRHRWPRGGSVQPRQVPPGKGEPRRFPWNWGYPWQSALGSTAGQRAALRSHGGPTQPDVHAGAMDVGGRAVPWVQTYPDFVQQWDKYGHPWVRAGGSLGQECWDPRESQPGSRLPQFSGVLLSRPEAGMRYGGQSAGSGDQV